MVDFNVLSQKPGSKIEQCNNQIYIGQMVNGKKHVTEILKVVDCFKSDIGEWVAGKNQDKGYEKFSNGVEIYGSYESNNKK